MQMRPESTFPAGEDHGRPGRTQGDSTGNNAPFVACVVAFVACLVLLLARIAYLGPPIIFADEYVYAAWAHYVSSREVSSFAPLVHNWFYSLLASPLFIEGGRLIEKARLLNVVIVLFALIPLYRTAAAVFSQRWALVVAVTFVAAGLGGYIAYFMPETLYTVLYVAVVLSIGNYMRAPTHVAVLQLIAAHGLLIATKPHGLFLLPVFVVVVAFYDARKQGIGFSRASLLAAAAYGAGALVLALAIDTAVWGHLLLNPFSGLYSATADKVKGLSVLHDAARVLGFHGAFIALVGSLPLLVSGVVSLSALLRRQLGTQANVQPMLAGAAVASLLGLGCLLAVTVVFTASIAGTGQYETLKRMHGRYYEAALITSLFVSLLVVQAVAGNWRWQLRCWIGGAAAVAAVAGYIVIGQVGWQEPHDYSFGFAAFNFPFVRYNTLLLMLGACVVFMVAPKYAGRALLVACAIYFFWGMREVDKHRQRTTMSAIDRYGEIMDMEQPHGRQRVMYRVQDADAYRAAFYVIDDGDVIHVPDGATNACDILRSAGSTLALHDTADSCGADGAEKDGSVTLFRAGTPSD